MILAFLLEYLLFQSLLLTIPVPMVELQAILAVAPPVGWSYLHHQIRTPCLLISCIRQMINLKALFVL